MDSGVKHLDLLVRQAIRDARSMKPGCSAREAAEITAGRRFSDDEWRRKGPIWVRNWERGASAPIKPDEATPAPMAPSRS